MKAYRVLSEADWQVDPLFYQLEQRFPHGLHRRLERPSNQEAKVMHTPSIRTRFILSTEC